MGDHEHNYQNHHSNFLICHGCKTVSTIEDALNTAAAKSRRELLAKLLTDHAFKKDAQDYYYSQVMADKRFDRVNDQGRLLDV